MKKGYMLKGSITVEMTALFPFIILVFIVIINLCYRIHDVCISGLLNEYGYVKEQQSNRFAYNTRLKEIDIYEVANRPIIDIFNPYKEDRIDTLRKRINTYKLARISGMYSDDMDELTEDKEKKESFKNAVILRVTHVLIEHAERIDYD